MMTVFVVINSVANVIYTYNINDSRVITQFFYFYCSISDDILVKTRGQSVTLECPLDVNACGELHSVKWFKGNDRIAVVSGDGGVANVEGELQGRLVMHLAFLQKKKMFF